MAAVRMDSSVAVPPSSGQSVLRCILDLFSRHHKPAETHNGGDCSSCVKAKPAAALNQGDLCVDCDDATPSCAACVAEPAVCPPGVILPTYQRSAVRPGIVHLGVGNFHRAHQAVYIDRCLHLPGQSQWGISGIELLDSPQQRAKAAGLTAQGGLYTLTEFAPEADPVVRVVGSMVEYIFAPSDTAAALARLASPDTRIVSMTITEGGYNIDATTGEFRLSAPHVAADLADKTGQPRTAFGLVCEALARRKAAGLGPFTILSCDNLRHNGDVARKAFLAYAYARDAALGSWMEQQVTFPNCMVDRITPATFDADVQRLNASSGVHDEVPVYSEDFIQWIIEDMFCAGRPELEKVGVQFTTDVHAYEQMKLRMLNASHTMLSMPAFLAGYATVHEAMADRRFSSLLDEFMEADVISSMEVPNNVDPRAYKRLLLSRFSNPAVADQLQRIAFDTAMKIPVFLQHTMRSAVARKGADLRRLAFLLACFARYLNGQHDSGKAFNVVEPNLPAADLALAKQTTDPAAPLHMSIFAGWGLDTCDELRALFVDYRASLASDGTLATLEQVLSSRS